MRILASSSLVLQSLNGDCLDSLDSACMDICVQMYIHRTLAGAVFIPIAPCSLRWLGTSIYGTPGRNLEGVNDDPRKPPREMGPRAREEQGVSSVGLSSSQHGSPGHLCR